MRSIFCIFALVATVFAFSQSVKIKGMKLTNPPEIDGIIKDEEWSGVSPVEGLYDDLNGAPFAENGKFWLAYDDQFIYFAARLADSAPGGIRANEYRTNVSLTGDDYVELLVDMSGSLSAFNSFQINPRGATNISIAGGRAAKREWLGAFVAKGRIVENGWEAEAKIPWRALSVGKKGPQDLRVNFRRFFARSQRSFSHVYTSQGQKSALTPVWEAVELPGPWVDHSIKLLPYVYAGYDEDTGHVANAGLDLRTSLTDQINLVGTINPDFRNIEQQILSIDFSRFERIAGEVRPFFQEGRQYSNSGIFASQRIGSFDTGVNAYGRINGSTSFGLISTVDFGKDNANVVNVSHNPDPTSSFRMTYTDLERPGLSNQAYLMRGTKLFGPWALTLRQLGSQDSFVHGATYRDVSLSYSQAGLSVQGVYTDGDRDFRPRLAFFQEVDLKGPLLVVDYNRNYDRGPINDWGTSLFGVSYDHDDGSFYRKEGNFSLYTTLRGGLAIVGNANWANFEGSKDHLYSLTVGGPRGNPYKNASVSVDTGRIDGIDYRAFSIDGAYRFSRKLQLSVRHQTVNYKERNEQTIVSANFDIDAYRSISGRAVRRDKDTNFYLAYRRSGGEGMEYFLILGDPNAPRYRNSLILKVVVPVQIPASLVKHKPALTVLSGPGASGSR